MSRNFDGELANQSGASYRSENNDWAQDWLTNRSGAGTPATTYANGTFVNTTTGLFCITNGANNASYPVFSNEGNIRTKDGTNSAPAHSFSGNTDTGAFILISGNYAISAGGTMVYSSSSTATSVYVPVTITTSNVSPLSILKDANSGAWSILLRAKNSSLGALTYASLQANVVLNTAGAENGSLAVYVVRAGALSLNTTFNADGSISTGTGSVQITNAAGTIRHAAIEQNGATTGQQLTWNGSTWAPSSAGSGTVSGSGTTNYIAKFIAAGAVGDTTISESSGSVTFASTAALDLATMGSNLVDSSGWTSTNWTGNFGTGFDHTTGNTSALSRSVTYTSGQRYVISFRIVGEASPAGSFTISFGGLETVTYSGGMFSGSTTDRDYSVGFVTTNNTDPISFNPTTDFNGTISNISVKNVSAARNSVLSVLDASSGTSFEIRPTTSTLGYTFIGVNAGKYIVGNQQSGGSGGLIGIGDGAMGNAISGKMSVAIGYNALAANGHPNQDIAIGYNALALATTGSYSNVAIGCNALPSLTDGHLNTAVGTDVGANLLTGGHNSYFGVHAGLLNVSGDYNVALGSAALYTAKGTGNVGVGFSAAGNLDTGDGNTIIGYANGITLVTGSNNLLIGTANFAADVPAATTSNYLSIGGAIKGDLSTGAINIPGALTAGSFIGGTITGSTWNGSVISGTYGGTGVNNGTKTITLGGNFVTSGAFNTTLTVTADTNVTLPTSGTLVNTAVATLSSLTSIGTLGSLTVSGTSTLGIINISGAVTMASDAGINFINSRYTDDASGCAIAVYKARGTQEFPAAVQNGDVLGGYFFRGYHTTGTAGFAVAAQIRARADAAPSGDVVQGRLDFMTTNSSGTQTIGLVIDSAQLVTVPVGGLTLGAASSVRGSLTVNRGTSTDKPGYVVLYSKGGTGYFFWVTDAGVLRVHTAAPSADTDGSAV